MVMIVVHALDTAADTLLGAYSLYGTISSRKESRRCCTFFSVMALDSQYSTIRSSFSSSTCMPRIIEDGVGIIISEFA